MPLDVAQGSAGKTFYLAGGSTDPDATLALYGDLNCQNPVYVTKLDKSIPGTPINDTGNPNTSGYRSARVYN